MTRVIVGCADAGAHDKHEDYRRCISHAGGLALLSGWTGIEFAATYDLDEPVRDIRNEAVHSAVERFTMADPDRTWTVREVAGRVGIGGLGPLLVGSAATVLDPREFWMADTGIDGFNLACVVTPETVSDLADLPAPELQQGGRCETAYRPGTLRENLFGAGPRLAPPHPAAACRFGAAFAR